MFQLNVFARHTITLALNQEADKTHSPNDWFTYLREHSHSVSSQTLIKYMGSALYIQLLAQVPDQEFIE
jgi:hypothetical protein